MPSPTEVQVHFRQFTSVEKKSGFRCWHDWEFWTHVFEQANRSKTNTGWIHVRLSWKQLLWLNMTPYQDMFALRLPAQSQKLTRYCGWMIKHRTAKKKKIRFFLFPPKFSNICRGTPAEVDASIFSCTDVRTRLGFSKAVQKCCPSAIDNSSYRLVPHHKMCQTCQGSFLSIGFSHRILL